jgi:hypothetical protein
VRHDPPSSASESFFAFASDAFSTPRAAPGASAPFIASRDFAATPASADSGSPAAEARDMDGVVTGGDRPFASGFTTGSGKEVAGPSRAAADRARKMFQEGSDALACGSPASGFTTAGGKAVAGPSMEAMDRARGMFADDADGSVSGNTFATPGIRSTAEADPLYTHGRGVSGFSTGSGRTLAAPSQEARARANALFLGPSDTGGVRETLVPGGFSTGSGKIVAGPSRQALERARAMFGDDVRAGIDGQLSAPAPSLGSDAPGPSKPSSKIHARSGDAGAASGNGSGAGLATPGPDNFRGPMTPFRTPLGAASNTASRRVGMSPAMRGKPIAIKTPSRRVGLGVTPVKQRRLFATPFKDRPPPPRAPQVKSAEPVFDCNREWASAE